MCNTHALASLFGRFSGRAIAPIDSLQDPADPVFAEMRQVAEENGYDLRVIWGERSAMHTDYNPKRANIHMQRQPDGTWCVGHHFHAG